jgi:hypothetical protein
MCEAVVRVDIDARFSAGEPDDAARNDPAVSDERWV